MLYLTKKDKLYRLVYYVGDEKMYSHKFTDLLDALNEAKKIMKEESVEYGLRIGKI